MSSSKTSIDKNYSKLETELLRLSLFTTYGSRKPTLENSIFKLFQSVQKKLNIDQEKWILRECLKLPHTDLLKKISKEMGCSITSKEGFTKVAPLIELAENRFFARKAMEMDLFNQTIESEYGKVEGLTLFDRLMKPYFTPSAGREPLVFYGNEKDHSCLKKILKGRNIFDFLMQKDGDGNLIAQESQYLKSILWLVLPGEEKNKQYQWEGGIRQALTNACRKNPEKMRNAVETSLFTKDGKLDQNVADCFWGSIEALSGWVGHIDILYNEKIITGTELQDLFSQFFKPSTEKTFRIDINHRDRITSFGNFIQNNWNIIKNLNEFSEEIWKKFDMVNIEKSFSPLQSDLVLGENIDEIKEKFRNEVLSFPMEVEKTILQRTSPDVDPKKKRNVLKI